MSVCECEDYACEGGCCGGNCSCATVPATRATGRPAPCPDDNDDDGNCGRPACPHCGGGS